MASAGFGEVRVSLGLDTTAATKALSDFFESIKRQEVGDPFKGLDKKFADLEKSAKELGYTWDATSKLFKNSDGLSKTIGQITKAVQDVESAAKGTNSVLGELNNSFGDVDGGARDLTDAVDAFRGTLEELGGAAKSASGDLKSVTDVGGDGISELASVSEQAAQRIAALGNAGDEAGSKLEVFSSASSEGVQTLSANAENASGFLLGLADSAETAGKAIGSIDGSGLEDVYKKASDAGEAASGAAGGIGELAKSLDKVAGTGEPIGEVARALADAQGSAEPASVSMSSLAQALSDASQTAQPLSAIPAELRNLEDAANAGADAASRIPAELEKGVSAGEQFASALRSNFDEVLKGIPIGIGVAIGNALLAPLTSLVNLLPSATAEFTRLDESIQLTLSIVGEGSDKFGQLADSIQKVNSTTAATLTEVGQVAQALARAGLSLEEIDEGLIGIVKGAEATGTAYDEMASIVVSALGAFQLSAADTADIADTLTVAANGANTNVSELGYALQYVGPIANAAGQNLQDTSLQLQVLADAGLKASIAGSALRLILTNLSIATAGAGEEFLELSGDSAQLQKALALIGANLTDTNGEIKTGKELILALKDAMNGLESGERALVAKRLAGTEGLPALNALISVSESKLDDLASALDNRAGEAARTANQALSGLSGSFKLLESNVTAALATIGNVVAVFLKPFVDLTRLALQALNSLPGPIKNLAVGLGVLGAAIGAINLALIQLKGSLLAAFATESLASIKNFVKTLTAAKIAETLSAWAKAVQGFASQSLTALTKTLVDATAGIKKFTQALQTGELVGSIASGIKRVTDALGGFAQAGAAAKQVKSLATSVGSVNQVAQKGLEYLPSTAAFMSLQGTAAKAATGGVAALGAAFKGFLAAIAPFAAAAGIVVGSFLLIKNRIDEYNQTAGQLRPATEKLNAALRETGKAGNSSAIEMRSWGKALESTLGPVDDFLSYIPGWQLFKTTIEGIGRFNQWNKAARETADLARESYKFGEALKATNQALDQNRTKMEGLNPASKEFAQLASQNITLVEGQSGAIKDRIAGIDNLIRALEKDEKANSRQIASLKKSKENLQNLLPVVEQNEKLIRAEARAYEESTGKIANVVAKLAELKIAREQAYAKADATAIYAEIDALADLRDGLTSEAEARAITAGAIAKAADIRIKAANDEIAEVDRLYRTGQITYNEYTEAVKNATKDIAGESKKRIQAEIDYNKAVQAAVNEALDDYNRLVQGIGNATQQINNTIGDIGSIGSSGLSAFRTLANEVTNFEVAQAERTKNEKIKNLEETYQRQKKLLEQAGVDTQALDERVAKAKRKLEQEYIKERKALMQKQIDFEVAAQKLQTAAKQLELDLWYEQQTVANQIAVQEAKIAVLKAQASGASKEEIDLLKNIVGLTEAQGGFIETMYDLKGEVLGIENQIAQQQINSKAAAEGVNSEFGKSVTNLDDIKGRMDTFQGKIDEARGKVAGFKENFGAIPDYADEAAQGARDRIEGAIRETDFTVIKEALQKAGYSETIAANVAEQLAKGFGEGATSGLNVLQQSFLNRFPDVIPKKLIQDELVAAISVGGDVSIEEAKKRLARMPEAIPTEQVATILGNAVGGGYEQGLQILANKPLPEGIFAPLTNVVGLAVQQGYQEGVSTSAATPVEGQFDYLTTGVAGAIELGYSEATATLPGYFQRGAQELPAYIQQEFEPLVAQFGQFGYDSGKQFGDSAWGFIAQVTSDSIASVGTTIVEGFTSSAAFVGSAYKTSLEQAGTEGGQAAAAGLANVTTAAETEAPKAGNAFTQMFDSIANIGADWGGKTSGEITLSLVEGVANTGQQVSDKIKDGIVSGYTAGIVPALGQIQEGFKESGTASGTAFGDGAEQTIGEKLTGFVSGLKTVWDTAVTDAVDAGLAASEGFYGPFEDIIVVANETAESVGEAFSAFIPREEIYDDLFFAITDGTREGNEEAARLLSKFPEAIPREEVTAILGAGIGGGVEEGERLLNQIKLSETAVETLRGGVSEALGTGGQEGTEAIGTAVQSEDQIKNAISSKISQGAEEGFASMTSQAEQAALTFENVFINASEQANLRLSEGLTEATLQFSTEIESAIDSLEFEALKYQLNDALSEPTENLKAAFDSLTISEELPSRMAEVAGSVDGIKEADLKGVFNDTKGPISSMKSGLDESIRKIGTMRDTMKKVYDWAKKAADASSKIKTGRAIGGPVTGGETYTVNELGREMFMSRAGTLSEIRTKPYGDWRAPSSGTVIPAHIAQQVREAREASKANANLTQLSRATSVTTNNYNQMGLQPALLGALRDLGASSNAPVTNNVQITSANPINDASRVLADLQRLRAMRRR